MEWTRITHFYFTTSAQQSTQSITTYFQHLEINSPMVHSIYLWTYSSFEGECWNAQMNNETVSLLVTKQRDTAVAKTSRSD
jgi:hypothetical protein